MSDKKRIIFLVISSLLLTALLYLLFAELYFPKNHFTGLLILAAIVADSIFFIRTFLKITSGDKN